HVPGAVGALGHHPSLGVKEADGEVLALARLLGVRGPVHGGADLHRDGLEGPPDHAEGDRIDFRALRYVHGFPCSVSRRAPLSMLIVNRSRTSVPRRPSMSASCGATS